MAYYIIIRGPLGCGKSTIAEKLSGKLGAKYFEVDRVIDENNLTKEQEEGYISQKSFLKANEIIAAKANELLNKDKSVIFDGNFYWQSQIDDLIKRLNYPHFVFTLKAPLAVCIARDKARAKTHGADAAEAVYRKSTEFDYGQVIDVNRPIEECVREITSYLAI